MRKKNLLKLIALAAISAGMVSCNIDPKTSEEDNSEPLTSDIVVPPVTSDTTTPEPNTSDEVPPEPDPDPDPQPEEEMPVYTTKLNKGIKSRAFDERFDRMYEDFSSSTLRGNIEGNGTFVEKSYLQVAIDHKNPKNFPTTPNNAIYKQASGDYSINSFDALKFRMRVSKGTLDYKDLVLGLRGDDAFNVYELSLADAVDNDGEALPELTDEFQDIIISPMNSIDDADAVYTSTSGEATSVKVLDQILGFHLMARGNANAVLEIESITGILGKNETVLDDFNREKPGSGTGHTWWNGSTGHIISRGVTLEENGAVELENDTSTEGYNYAVVSLKGAGDISVSLKVENTYQAPIAWDDLVDDEGNKVVAPVNGAYGDYVINLGGTTGITGFKLSTTQSASITKLFLTNMEVPQAAVEFPTLDIDSANVFDDFSRTQLQIAKSYEESVADSSISEAGLNHVISYHNSEMIKVQDGTLQFDASNLGAADYINFVEGSKTGRDGHKYLVLSTKLEDGATLDKFRIQTSQNTVYYKDMYVAEGLKTNDAINPYTKDDFTYQVIDLDRSGLGAITDEITMYYSGTGKLSIDSIFFCSEPGIYAKSFPGEATKIMDSTNKEHQWASLGRNEGAKTITITYRGDGVCNLESFRIESVNNDATFANAKMSYTINGEAGSKKYVASATEDTILVVDLEASGFVDFNSDVTLVLGDWAKGYMDVKDVTMNLDSKTIKKWTTPEEKDVTLAPTDSNKHAWSYLGWSSGASSMKLHLVGDGVATLESLRFDLTDAENNVTTHFCNNGKLKIYADGTPVKSSYVVPEAGVDMEFDFADSTGSINLAGVNVNIIYGDWADIGATLQVTSLSWGFSRFTVDYIMSNLPEMKK